MRAQRIAIAVLSVLTVVAVIGIVADPAAPVAGLPIPAAGGAGASPTVPPTDGSTPGGSTAPTAAVEAGGPVLPVLRPPFDKVLGFHGDGKVAYLTFDDGPGPDTPKVLEALDKAGVKATFCQVGSRIDNYPDTERRVIADGHTLCNHSWSHPDDLAAAPAATIEDEIGRTQAKLAEFGVTAHYFRAPGGSFGDKSTTLRQVAQLADVVPLGWGVDSDDWTKPGTAAIVKNVLGAVQPGAIILMHDAGGTDRSQTVAAIPGIVSGLKAAGYTLAPLPAAGLG